MKLLPYHKFCIITSLKPAEVEKRLQSEITADEGFSFRNLFADAPNTYFRGTAQNGNFKFSRIFTGRNSFVPIVTVHTENWLNGSRLYITTRLHWFVAVFMCFWLGVVGIACIGVLIAGVTSHKSFAGPALIPFIMFAGGYAMTMFGYKSELSKVKDILLPLLDGEIADKAI